MKQNHYYFAGYETRMKTTKLVKSFRTYNEVLEFVEKYKSKDLSIYQIKKIKSNLK